ncbi:MFS transporter [Pseudonocardia halophobica]|uniref:MFS transporter n=1 Tax=Pseudonocardia halophobica TaxID=29401 RepID=A0A9W6L6X7_9PSEU|nr:MFS transporter [Pseudonocardia halophobica]GLL14025.1 MFS transporter [Pseudonocardia halophobica]
MTTDDVTRPEAPDGAAPRQSPIRTFLVSGVGTALEYYDFAIYGLAAAVVFNTQFFPGDDPLLGTLYAFAAFGTGFVARPIGGMVIGHFGDRVGRRKMLILTLTVMGLTTFLIGCLPGYATLGWLAPALLVLLRLVQGFAAGGEWGGAALFGIEAAPRGKRGLWGSFTSMGVGLGGMLGAAVFAIVSAVFADSLTDWAWRLPFWIGGVLVLAGLMARLAMPQEEAIEVDKEAGLPIVRAFKHAPKTILLGIGVAYGYNTIAYVGSTFFLSYLTQHGYGSTFSLIMQLVHNGVLMTAAPFWAMLSDRAGRKKVMVAGAIAYTVFLFVFFPVIGLGSAVFAVFAFVFNGITMGLTQGPLPAFLGEQFPAKIRYTGISTVYQIGAALGGGTGAFVAAALLLASGGNAVVVSLYGGFAMLILALCVLGLRETAKATTEQVNEGVAGRSATVGHAQPA